MQYLKEPGIVYDCIYYGIMYFDRQRSNKNAESGFLLMLEGANKNSEYYSYFEDLEVAPAKETAAFFYHDIISSPISELFKENLAMKDTFNKFIALLSDKERLKLFVLRHVLSEQEIDEVFWTNILKRRSKAKEELSLVLKSAGYDKTIERMFIQLFINFDKITDELIVYFHKIHYYMVQMHKANRKQIKECLLFIESFDNINFLSRIWKLDAEQVNRANVSICFINQTLCFCNCSNKKRDVSEKNVSDFTMFGIYYQNNTEVTTDLYNTSVATFSFALGSDKRYKIVELITESGGNITESEIAKNINIKITSIRRHCKILIDNSIIFAEILGDEDIVYSLNTEYFNSLYPKIKEFFNLHIMSLDRMTKD